MSPVRSPKASSDRRNRKLPEVCCWPFRSTPSIETVREGEATAVQMVRRISSNNCHMQQLGRPLPLVRTCSRMPFPQSISATADHQQALSNLLDTDLRGGM